MKPVVTFSNCLQASHNIGGKNQLNFVFELQNDILNYFWTWTQFPVIHPGCHLLSPSCLSFVVVVVLVSINIYIQVVS